MRQLKTFLVVADALSFTQAARELGYVQSAVTAHVKGLEEELGVRLFDRLGRKIALTDAGRRLRPYARTIAEMVEEAGEAATGRDGGPVGSVVVSAPETLCAYRLPPVLKEFRARYPRVRLTFRPTSTGALDAGLERQLTSGEVDLAFVVDEPAEAGEMVAEPLAEEVLVLVAPPGNPLTQRGRVGPADLAGEHLLLTDKGCAYRALFERGLSRAGKRPLAYTEFASGEAIKQCVMAGMGIAVLSRVSVARELEEGKLVELGWEDPGFRLVTQVVRHKGKWLSPALEALLEVTRAVFAAEDGGETTGLRSGNHPPRKSAKRH